MVELLRMEKITKNFGGIRALNKVDFGVSSEEVHGLVGENGAGKSTLIKVLNGVVPKNAGEIYFQSRKVKILHPHQAQLLGISTVYQERNLVPDLSVGENIFLGREPKHGLRFIDYAALHERSKKLLELIGSNLDPRTPALELSIAQQQMVEIAKALLYDARLIVMDEPSAVLTEHELERLFGIISSLKARGKSVVYISHRLEEIFKITDRVTVLRDGKCIGTLPTAQTSKSQLVKLMVGRAMQEEFPARKPSIREPILSVKKITRRGKFKAIEFQLHQGEILGVFGLVGAGRTEVARAIFGADPMDSGEVVLEGKRLNIRSPGEAIQRGIVLATENRKDEGLLLEMSVKANITLSIIKRLTRLGIINHQEERELVGGLIKRMKIKLSSSEEETVNLSGGNQQKVVLARWLCSKAKVLILDEPTRGIDVGAKWELYLLMDELAKQRMAILMLSSELPEVLALSDRILVMHEGRITGRFSHEEATAEKVMYCATASHPPSPQPFRVNPLLQGERDKG